MKVSNTEMEDVLRANGINSAAKLSRLTGVRATTIGNMLNLKLSCFNEKNSVRIPVQKIADFLNCNPKELFPEKGFYPQSVVDRFEKHIVEVYKNMVSHAANRDPELLLEDMEQQIRDNNAFEEIIKPLKDRHKTILKGRFEKNKTFQQIGLELGITRERVRQLEIRALNALRGQDNKKRLFKLRELYLEKS